MTSSDICVHIFDAARPDDDDDVYPINVYTPVVPNVGQHIHYWVDYPRHLPNGHKCQPGEPVSIEGTVNKVDIEYRRMRYGERQNDVTIIMVYLDGYTVKLPPKESK
jgi:hypothetical protein